MKIRFNKKLIDALPPCPADSRSREAEYSDTEVSGLKLLVGKSGTKTFLLRYTLPRSGQKRSMSLGCYGLVDIAEARQKAIECKTMVAKGIDPQVQRVEEEKAKPLTFRDFVTADYLPHAYCVKRSAKDDESRLRHHILPVFGDLALDAKHITTQQIQLFHDRKRNELSPATANRLLAIIKRIFNLAILWGKGNLDRNPVKGVKMHAENNQRHRYLAGDELRQFLIALEKEANRTAADLFTLLLATGVRRQEAITCRWENVNLEEGRCYLPKTKTGSRFVLLNPLAVEILKNRPRKPGNPFVFPSATHPGKHIADPSRAFRRVLSVAKITNFRIHDLRHSHASLAINAGASLYTVQHLLGHHNSSTTARYSHLAEENIREATGQVASILQAAMKEASVTD